MTLEIDYDVLIQNVARGTDDDIYVVRAYIADNMEQSGGVLTENAVWNYMKKLFHSPSEYNARIEGIPRHFAGVVFDELDRDIHLIDDFNVPTYWSFYESLDPADGKPTAWSFFAVSPEEYELDNERTVNAVYWIGYEKCEGLPPSEIAKVINQKRAYLGYKTPLYCVLDAKYGVRKMNKGDDYTNWQKELRRYDPGVSYVLSDSKPGSITVGEAIVKEYLKPKYNALKEEHVPVLRIFRNMEHETDPFNPISHLFNYAHEEKNPSKRTEEYKDFVDTLRYLLTRYPRYWDQERRSEPRKPKSYFRRVA